MLPRRIWLRENVECCIPALACLHARGRSMRSGEHILVLTDIRTTSRLPRPLRPLGHEAQDFTT